MTLKQQIFFWIAVFAIFIIFLLVFRTILLPFVAGMALAYLLDPIADWFERQGMSRLAATLTILVLSIFVLGAAIVILLPILINQLIALISNIPDYIEKLRGQLTSLFNGKVMAFLGLDATSLQSSLGDLMKQGAAVASSVFGSILVGGRAVLNILSLFVITPVVAFYLLYDWDRMIARINSWLPRDYVDEIRRLAREMDATISAFVRGQILVCVLLGTFYAVGLMTVGLNYGLLIGLGAGLLSFIPYLGFAVGFVTSIVIALVQFSPDWIWIAATVAVFLVGQLLEGYVLQPYLIGERVGLHPVWLLFALFAFGLLFGFVGLIVAIPASAAIEVLIRYALGQYLASSIYRGSGDGPSVKRRR